MADSSLIINIAGKSDDFKAALDDVKKQTASLESQLTSIATVSGVAFAALTAEVVLSVKAFGVQEKAIGEVTIAMQNQGIYTKELSDSYRSWGEEIEKKTGIDSDAISSAQALAQSYLGETLITEELTKKVVDLAVAKKMDLGAAFEVVAKGISGNTIALKKMGIVVDEHLTKDQKLAEITEQLSLKFGGQAEQAAKAGGGLILLEAAVGNLQKAIGERLAPIMTVIYGSFTKFINLLSENKWITDLIVSFGLAALAVTGIVTAIGAAGIAFVKFRAILAVTQTAMAALGITTKALVGATGIGLLLIILAEIYLNWSSIWPRMQAVYLTFVDNIKGFAIAVGKLLLGAHTFNPRIFKEGMDAMREVLKSGVKEYSDIVDKKIAEDKAKEETQNIDKKAAAKKRNEIVTQAERDRLAVLKASDDLVAAEAANSSKTIVDIKKAELETLKQIADDGNKAIRGQLEKHLADLKLLEADARAQDAEAKKISQDGDLMLQQEYLALSSDQQKVFDLTMRDSLNAQIQTENQVRLAALQKRAQDKIKANNEYILNEQKFGKTYADLHKFLNQEQVKGANAAAGELAALQGSSNSTLFAIGKAAAVANVGVKTAESAMNIYAGFSTIPIFGQALGIAGAAAAVAFGGEQIRKIMSTPKPTGMAAGGLVTGGIAGKDSVPALLMPNELVVPARNFEEVVGAVQGSRGNGSGQGGMIEISMKLQDNLMDFIEAKLVERKNLNLSIQGA